MTATDQNQLARGGRGHRRIDPAALRAARAEGTSVAALAAQHQVTRARIYQLLNGRKPQTTLHVPRSIAPHLDEIKRRLAGGEYLRAICADLHLSYQQAQLALPPVATLRLARSRTHGTRSCYNRGCRCERCREANRKPGKSAKQ